MSKVKSDVWKYFSKDVLGGSVAKCKFCGKNIKTSGNTSNLKGHLKVHQKQYDDIDDQTEKGKENQKTSTKRPLQKYLEVEPKLSTSKSQRLDKTELDTQTVNEVITVASTSSMESFSSEGQSVTQTSEEPAMIQPKLPTVFSSIASHEVGGKKNSRITDVLVYFVCKDNMPFNIVEGKGFKKFIRELSPLYKIPSRNTIKSRIINKYEATSNLYKEKLRKSSSLTITSDIWTETMQMKSFLGITVHFLEGTKMVSINLDCIELSESHTGDYICDSLQTALHTWNINLEQVIAVITDNDAKMLKAVGKLFGMNKHLGCFAHTLNLSVENAIKQSGINELLTKVRNIVKFFKASTNASDELRKAQMKEGILEGKVKKVILDVATRWNSKYYMCERFLDLLNILSSIMLNKPNSPPMLSAGEIELLKEIIHLLKTMEKLTTEASGEQYVTISKVIPLINCTIKNFSAVGVTLPLALSLKEALLKELQKRFGAREQVLLLAYGTFLDPRFKNVHFNNPLASSNILNKINTLVLNIINSKADSLDDSDDLSVTNTDTEDNDIWSFHKSLTQKQNIKSKNLTNSDSLHAEIRMYLSAPLANLKENPLEVWEGLKQIYPNLYQVARRYLGVVCSSVPSERLFSQAGDTVTQERNRLSGKLLPKLLFLNSLPDEFW